MSKPGTFGTIEAQLFLSLKTAAIMGASAAAPYFFTAATGYLQGQGGWLAIAGVALGAAARAIYLRQTDNTK